jgi:hypothetical protein
MEEGENDAFDRMTSMRVRANTRAGYIGRLKQMGAWFKHVGRADQVGEDGLPFLPLDFELTKGFFKEYVQPRGASHPVFDSSRRNTVKQTGKDA